VLNRCLNVTVERLAVTSTAGRARIHVFADPCMSGWSSLGDQDMRADDGCFVRPTDVVEVPTETMDGYCKGRGIADIDFCKVDVEGFERHAFAGASTLLSQSRIGVVCFEISESPLSGEGDRPAEVFDMLTRYGYRIFRRAHGSGTLIGPIDPDGVENRLLRETLRPYHDNYFASRRHDLASGKYDFGSL